MDSKIKMESQMQEEDEEAAEGEEDEVERDYGEEELLEYLTRLKNTLVSTFTLNHNLLPLIFYSDYIIKQHGRRTGRKRATKTTTLYYYETIKRRKTGHGKGKTTN